MQHYYSLVAYVQTRRFIRNNKFNLIQIVVGVVIILFTLIAFSYILYRLISFKSINRPQIPIRYLKEGDVCKDVPNAACHPDFECSNNGVCKLSVSKLKPTCWHILQSNTNSPDGAYFINVKGNMVQVYCEMSGGGWTRIMNKANRNTFDFNKTWSAYRDGFGPLEDNYWLGLHNMHLLTRLNNMTLRMVMYNNSTLTVSAVNWIEYGEFRVLNEERNFELQIGKYLGGNVPDHSDYHYGMPFSTSDKDNDLSRSSNCAATLYGGWWFNSCFYFCFTCEGTGIAGHYRFPYSSYRFFKNIKMLVRPTTIS